MSDRLSTKSTDLQGRVVFLSASYPSIERDPEYFQTADPDEISHCIVAVARAVLSANGRLVFGGHPSVSPLVLMIANEYARCRQGLQKDAPPRILVYQSDVFDSHIPPATEQLFELGHARLTSTERINNERPRFTRGGTLDPESVRESLKHMRVRMIRETEPVGAFFVAGMEGIQEEAEMCATFVQRCSCFFIGSPGGAAAIKAESSNQFLPVEFRDLSTELQISRAYPSLVQTIISRLSNLE